MSWLLCQYMISQVQPTKAWKSCFSIPSVVWELESRSSDPFLLKELRSLIFTFVPASKVLTRVLKSCPFDSLKGEMLWKSKLLPAFAWFCCILCLLFFHWCYWELWLWRKCGTSTVIWKSFFSHFGSVYISVLVLSSPVKCIWLNLLNWPLKCSTLSETAGRVLSLSCVQLHASDCFPALLLVLSKKPRFTSYFCSV